MAATGAHHRPEAMRYRTAKSERLVEAVEKIWLEEGDLALNLRRVFKEAKATNRDLYLSFGSRDLLLEHVADELAHHVAEWPSIPTGEDYLSAALQRPAAWRALLLGKGPHGYPAGPDRFSSVHAAIRDTVGGDIELAKLDGVIAAIVAGRLDPAQLNGRPLGTAQS